MILKQVSCLVIWTICKSCRPIWRLWQLHRRDEIFRLVGTKQMSTTTKQIHDLCTPPIGQAECSVLLKRSL